jgi:hypothetical protein
LFVGISVLVVLCVLATTPAWAEKCKQVTIAHGKIISWLEGPENCDGYDGCVTLEVSGTFNGTLTESWFDADAVHVVDATWTFTNYAVIETPHGKIYFLERSIADFAAPNGFAFHANVTGGTGRYEGATGWLGAFDSFEGGAGRTGGEVCWPGK